MESETETETETQQIENQGALKSPLSGDLNHPGPQNLPPEGPGPVPVERGGGWGVGARNKVLKTLEKMPPDLSPDLEVLRKVDLRKELWRYREERSQKVGR